MELVVGDIVLDGSNNAWKVLKEVEPGVFIMHCVKYGYGFFEFRNGELFEVTGETS